MTHDLFYPSLHPAGEQPPVEGKGPLQGVSLDSFAGPVHVEWDTEAALTPLGSNGRRVAGDIMSFGALACLGRRPARPSSAQKVRGE